MWAERRRSAGGQSGFSLVDTLFAVGIMAAVMIPLLTWMVITIQRGNDQGQPIDSTTFAQVSRFLSRDLTSAVIVEAPEEPGARVLGASSCATLNGLDPTDPTWLRLENSEGLLTEYRTSDVDGSTELVRTQCRRDDADLTGLGSTVVGEFLQDQTGPGGTAPVLVGCDFRSDIDPEECGKVVMTLQGSKSSPVSLEAARRVDPPETAVMRPRAAITCDPRGCRGYRQADNLFTIGFDGSLSSAPEGVYSYAWSFSTPPVTPGGTEGEAPFDPVLPGEPHPVTGDVVPSPGGLANTGRFTFQCDDQSDAWRDELGTGNSGCIFKVTLRIEEQNTFRTATASQLIVIENSAPVVRVIPNPIAAFRGVPVPLDASGTFDPDGGQLQYQWDFGDGTGATSEELSPKVEDPANPGTTVDGYIYRCTAQFADLPCRYTTTLSVSDGDPAHPATSTTRLEIPVTVENAAPEVSIEGPQSLDDPDLATDWSASAFDPDGNENRTGRAEVPTQNLRWTLSKLGQENMSSSNPNYFEPIVIPNPDADPPVPASRTVSAALPYGTFTLALEATDVDGLTVRTEIVIRVNTPPVARASIGKGEPPGTRAAEVFSPRGPTFNNTSNTPDLPIILDGSGSYDPDGSPRPGVPPDPDAKIIGYHWRVWGQSSWGWTAPTTWSECPSTISAANPGRACILPGNVRVDPEGGQAAPTFREALSQLENWPRGTYRLALVAEDNNTTFSACANASPWTSNCVQPLDPAARWWVSLRINERPSYTTFTYENALGADAKRLCRPLSLDDAGVTGINNAAIWPVCRTATYTFKINQLVDDIDQIQDMDFRWVLPFDLGDEQGEITTSGPELSVTLPSDRPVPEEGQIRVYVTDSEGGERAIIKTLRLRNHPPAAAIGIDQEAHQGVGGSWTSPNPSTDPFQLTAASLYGDPDGTVVFRRWTIQQRTQNDVPVGSPITIEATRTGGNWSCGSISGGPAIAISQAPDSDGGCSRLNLELSDWGRFTVQLMERDNEGDEATDVTTLRVLKPAKAVIRLRDNGNGGDNCELLPTALLYDSQVHGDVHSFPNGSPEQVVCFDARASEEGNGGELASLRWDIEGAVASFRDVQPNMRFRQCATWIFFGELPGCLRYDVTLTVMNEANYPTTETVTVRFNAKPRARIGLPLGTAAAHGREPSGRTVFRLRGCAPSCTTTLRGAGPALTADGPSNDPLSLSADADGPPDLQTPVAIADGNYGWRVGTSTAVPFTPGGATFAAGSFNPGDRKLFQLRVTDGDGYQSDVETVSIAANKPPEVGPGGSGFNLPNIPAYLPLGVNESVRAIVPEAGDITNGNCSSLNDNTDDMWFRIPGMLPGEYEASRPHYRWTFTNGSETRVLEGAVGVECRVLGGAGATIVSSPPIQFDNPGSWQAELVVYDSDGAMGSSGVRTLQVLPQKPEAVIEPRVGVAPENTPAPKACSLQLSGGRFGETEDCLTWTETPPEAHRVRFTGVNSWTPTGLPPAEYQWGFYTGMFGTGAVAGANCTANNAAEFACTVPATHGWYRAVLRVRAVAGGTLSDPVEYFMKVNKVPVASITRPESQPTTLLRGEAFGFTCSVTDPDSNIAVRGWALRQDGTDIIGGSGQSCSGVLPDSPSAGSATLVLWGEDVEGGTVSTSYAVTIANRPPVAAFTLSDGTRECDPMPPWAEPGDPWPACVFNPPVGLVMDGVGSIDPDSGITLTYAWTVTGPGGFSQNRTGVTPPAVNLVTPGSYTITLRVTDPDGQQSDPTSRTIRVNQVPTVTMQVDGATIPTQGWLFNAEPPVDLRLNALVVDPDTPLTYLWTVYNPSGDVVRTASTPTTSLLLNSVGVYTATLTVTDAYGLNTTVSRTITVNRAPTAQVELVRNGQPCATTALVPCVVNPPLDIVAEGIGADDDGSTISYSWEVVLPDEDQTVLSLPDTGTTVDLGSVLDENGTGLYEVRLVVTDNFGMKSPPVSAWVVRNPQPVVELPADVPPVTRGQAFSVQASAFDPEPSPSQLTFTWEVVQDGEVIFGPVISSIPILYGFMPAEAALGPAEVRVLVQDEDGGEASATQQIEVVSSPPMIESIHSSPTARTLSASSGTWTFTANATDPDGTIAAMHWSITSGATTLFETTPGDLIPELTHEFVGYGDYTVTLTVTDNTGLSTSDSIDLRLNQPPTAVISGPDAVIPQEFIQFDASASYDGAGPGDGTIAEGGYFWQVFTEAGNPANAVVHVEPDPEVPGTEGATPEQPLIRFEELGVHRVQVRVLDDDGAFSDWVELLVEVVNP